MHRDEVYRDPETGQFVAVDDDEPVELTYADHEFLNVRLTPTFGRDGTDEDSERGAQWQVDQEVLDLENDELAMLAWMNASMSAYVSAFNEESTTKGGATVLGEIGSNLAGDEFLSQADVAAGVQQIESDAGVFAGGNVANDEPGIWGVLNLAVISGYNNAATADEGGPYDGNSVPDNDRLRREFYSETRGGPYIDATDDVNLAIYVDKDNANARIEVELAAQMAFVVFEYEHRRAEFAPYDPGPGHM